MSPFSATVVASAHSNSLAGLGFFTHSLFAP